MSTGAEHLSEIPSRLGRIRTVAEDRARRLWVLTENEGLKMFKGKHETTFLDSDAKKHALWDICFGLDGSLYVVSTDILYRLRPGRTAFETVPLPGIYNMVTCETLRNGTIAIGTDGQGLVIYNPVALPQAAITVNPYHSKLVDLEHSKVQSILEDRAGNLWFGMLQKGVYMQPAVGSAFHTLSDRFGDVGTQSNYAVQATLIDHSGRMWVGTDGDGLLLHQPDGKVQRHFTNVPQTILCLAEAPNGNIWMGSYNDGCGWLDAGANYHRAQILKGQGYHVFGVTTDREGNVWIGTLGQGLFKVDAQGRLLKHYTMTKNADSNAKMNSLVNAFIMKVTLSRDQQRLYVSTCMGLACLDLKSGSWLKAFGVNCIGRGLMIRNMAEAPDGSLYLATDNGLAHYSHNGRLLKNYSTDDGLPSNGVMSLGFDAYRQLWVGTSLGLARMGAGAEPIQVFSASDGLPGNEFSEGALALSADGTVVLVGGTKGISWFNINDIRTKTWKPDLRISDFIVDNSSILPDGDRYSMDYRDNSFIIHLSTFTFTDAGSITYLYRMDKDPWVRLPQGSNEITFSHLPPGTYQFAVKAVRQGQESKERIYTIHVGAPWYRSTLAYLIYILLLIGIFMLYRRYRVKQERAHLLLQEHIHAEELSEQRLRFFMNMSHEIRTPMTLIVTPLMQLIKEDTDAHRRGVYRIIKRNAERILHLINQMMDLRKLDKGLMVIRRRETDLVAFIDDICQTFQTQAEAKHIHFTFNHSADHLPALIDRSNFDKVVVNIVSNAFKYTQPGGNIAINLEAEGEDVRISVSDDGEKIPEDKLKHIFERFYQVPGATNDATAGTGIGLDLARSIVELHFGAISAQNNADKGCTFTVSIPQWPTLTKEELDLNQQAADSDDNKEELIATEAELLEDEAENQEAEVVEEAATTVSKPRIVVVEDDVDIADYLKQQLSKDFVVTTYVDGKEALAGILRQKPQLVISDVMMPVMDGNELCSKLKANITTNDIPVILLTAKTSDEAKIVGLESGADAYLQKPFNMDVLLRMVNNLIAQRRMLQNKFAGKEDVTEQIDQVRLVSADDKLMQKIIKVINDNLSDSDLDVEKIATEAGVSRANLYRKMKEMTNQTPHNFIRNQRLQMAAMLLREKGITISEVVYACGFSNLSSFSTMFKNMYGMSPRDWSQMPAKEN